jgi:protein TonB
MTKNIKTLLLFFLFAGIFQFSFSQIDPIPLKFVEENPKFMGEDISVNAFMKYINENLKYPVFSTSDTVNGRVIATFVLDSTGKVTDVKILSSLREDFDNEVIKVLLNSPPWTPGKIKNKPVNVRLVYPFVFKKGTLTNPISNDKK